MKKADFSMLLSTFLSEYLPNIKNVSSNTISSYCDTFRLFLTYCRDEHRFSIEKLSIDDLNPDIIHKFLSWLETERNCSISTRNQRLAAIHAFFKYIQAEKPQSLLLCQKIIDIPSKRKSKPVIKYLTAHEIKIILEQPNISTTSGRRDLVILSILYDTGARVQELVDLSVRDIRLDYPAKVHLTGKGRKSRIVPIMGATSELLENYLGEQRLLDSGKQDYPLFCNQQRRRLTRAGVTYILKKYAGQAATISPQISDKVTPHILRHSKAMHLLEAGVNLIYIRDLLGHVDVSTTEVYARASTEMKREALEKLSTVKTPNVPSWTADSDLLSWLKDFGKSK